MSLDDDDLATADRRARPRPAKLAVVRNDEGRVLLATPTFEPDEACFLDACRDWLVEERRHASFRETNTSTGPFDRLDGTLGPMRQAMRNGTPVTVELTDHLGWGPAADAARAIPDAAAVWTTRIGWAEARPAKRIRSRRVSTRSVEAGSAKPAQRITCPKCSAAPTRAALRERFCQECGADLPRPGR